MLLTVQVYVTHKNKYRNYRKWKNINLNLGLARKRTKRSCNFGHGTERKSSSPKVPFPIFSTQLSKLAILSRQYATQLCPIPCSRITHLDSSFATSISLPSSISAHIDFPDLERSTATFLIDEAVSDLLLSLLEQNGCAEDEQDVYTHNTKGTRENDIEEVVGVDGEGAHAADLGSSRDSRGTGGIGHKQRRGAILVAATVELEMC